MSKIQSLIEQQKLAHRPATKRPARPAIMMDQATVLPPASTENLDSDDPSLGDLVGIIFANKAIILWTVAGFLAAGLVFILLATPLYKAESRLMIEPQGDQPLPVTHLMVIVNWFDELEAMIPSTDDSTL